VTLLKREPKDFSLNQVRQEIRHAAQLRPLYHIGMRIMVAPQDGVESFAPTSIPY
jgi:hypothetical protein